jgi:uncharacterized membrane protein
LAHLVLLLLLGAVGLQTVYYYPQLPETVASHFSGSGTPNGWSSRQEFFGIYWGMVVVMLLVLYGLPLLYRRFPKISSNIPNKEYWMAPERREETFAFLSARMHWFANATIVFLISTMQLVILTNFDAQPNLPAGQVWTLTGFFLSFTVGWMIHLYYRFAKPGC